MISDAPFSFVTWFLSSICLLPWFNFCDFFPEMSGFPYRHHAIILHQNVPAISQISGINSTLLFGLITNYLHQPWHPATRRFLPAKARAVFSLTMCGCPVCSKTLSCHRALPVTLPVFHIVSNPGLLSVSNSLPIDNIVLPANAPSFCHDPGDHSLDDADGNYHPIYATSIDGKDKLASNDDDLVPTNDDMEDNSCCDSHTEPPSDVDKGDVVGDTSPPPSPTWYFLLLNLLHQARTTMASPFHPLSHFPTMWRIFAS